MKWKTLSVVLLAGALVTACSRQDETLAEINGDAVTRAEFDAYLKFKRLAADTDERRAKLLDQYVERAALTAAIEEAIADKDVIDRDLLDAELAEFRKEMLISRYFDRYLAETVTDEAVTNYYNAHPEQFEQRQAKVAHVLIRTDRNMGEEERQAKLTTAREALAKIRAGEDFAKVAANYSEDKISGKKGGDLGWLKEGSIAPDFSKTVFGMEPGAVEGPLETPFGFHIVKLVEGPVVAKRPLDAVKGDIRYRLRNEAKDAELKRLLGLVEIEKE